MPLLEGPTEPRTVCCDSTHTGYDSLNRPITQYLGYDLSETTYADAGSVTNDVIMEQTSRVYDAAGIVIQTSAKQRYHNAPDTQKGALGSPSLTPNARVTWQAAWADGAGRPIAAANYGTNGGAAFTRPATVPTRSDSILITSNQYNDAGDRVSVFDPANRETRFEFDAASRTTKLIENYQASGPVQPDVNRTTQTSYNADGNVATLTAWNSQTGNQTTNYTYGTTLSDSSIATSTLLQQVAYPDSVGGSDVVLLSYNRLGQRKGYTDQRGCTHAYLFDGLGRQIHDCVTAVGTGVDASIRRLSTQYDVRGFVTTMSSWDNATVGSGSVVNQVQNAFNDFAQLTQSYQAHAGTVNTGTTPKVQYSYANGSANTIRITGMTYPNGRNVVDDYGTAGSIDDACSRIRGMKDFGASTNLVDYSYLGLGGFVKTVYPESTIQYTLIGTSGGTNPDSGDIYLGIDRFGRVTDANWANTAGSTALGRVKYGYDRVSNRTWRDNLSPGMTVGSDELYSYDQLQRLQNLDRGTLNGTQTAITSPTFGQNWTLDETGNWSGFKEDNTGGGTWNLDQIRTANTVNEITTLTNTTSKAWTTPAYDAAGNMTRIPVPGILPDGVAWNNMSLSEWDNLKLDDWDEMTIDNVEADYDAWNRLVRLHVGDSTLAVYAYDARGYRIRKDSYSSGTLSEARHYYYTPGWQCIEERVGTSTTANRQSVWGLRYIDDLVLRDRDTDGNGTVDERRYCLQDGNWNVIAIANTTGAVTERFSYDAYGVPTFLTSGGTVQVSSPTGWETLYAGYRWDGDPSKMYYVRNRFLLPYVGTWNRRDPIEFSGMDPNLGGYVGNHPIIATDPSGLVDPAMSTVPEWLVIMTGGSISPLSAYNQAAQSVNDGVTVWNNVKEDSSLSTLNKYYTAGGTVVGSFVGVRGVSDACSVHDAVDGHKQSGMERITDGVTGSIQLVGTAAGIQAGGSALLRSRPLATVPGTATIMEHPGTPMHTSIQVTEGTTTLHTHQVVTAADMSSTQIVTAAKSSPGPVTASTTVPLSNAQAAISRQIQLMKQGNLGPYDKVTNNCLSHVADVAKAGGAKPSPPPPSGTAQTRWWLNLFKGKNE